MDDKGSSPALAEAPSFRFFESTVPESEKDEYYARINRYKKINGRMKGSDTVLEIGCSSGYGSKFFRYCARYDGVDRDQECIEYANANYAKHPALHFHWTRATTFMMDVPDRYYKMAVCLDVLHENRGQEEAILKELLRVCDRALFLSVKETPYFSIRDAHAILKRLRPSIDMQELLQGSYPLHCFTRL